MKISKVDINFLFHKLLLLQTDHEILCLIASHGYWITAIHHNTVVWIRRRCLVYNVQGKLLQQRRIELNTNQAKATKFMSSFGLQRVNLLRTFCTMTIKVLQLHIFSKLH